MRVQLLVILFFANTILVRNARIGRNTAVERFVSAATMVKENSNNLARNTEKCDTLYCELITFMQSPIAKSKSMLEYLNVVIHNMLNTINQIEEYKVIALLLKFPMFSLFDWLVKGLIYVLIKYISVLQYMMNKL